MNVKHANSNNNDVMSMNISTPYKSIHLKHVIKVIHFEITTSVVQPKGESKQQTKIQSLLDKCDVIDHGPLSPSQPVHH